VFVIGRLLAIALLAAPAADAPLLTAEAGLDGVGRPGRWLPVRVTIDARTEDINGDLVAEWGRARVRRALILPAPSRVEFDLYIRTGDVRDVVLVRLEQGGRETSRVTLPVRIVGVEDQTALTVPAGRWPHSWRGYDAADALMFDTGDAPSARSDRDALALWRALRDAGDADRALPAAEPVPPASSPASHAATTAILYTIAIAAVPLLVRRGRSRVLLLYPAIALVVAGGSAAAWATGRSSAIVVRHQSFAEQFEGAATTLVSMRATAQYPADEDFSLRADTMDGVLDGVSSSASGDETRLDAEGRPMLDHRAGLGSTESFSVEATSGFRAFDVTHDGPRTRIVNVSTAALDRCEFPPAFSTAAADRLAPGQSIESSSVITGPDPIVACRFAGAPLAFTEPHHAVTTSGSTLVVYHLAGARDQ